MTQSPPLDQQQPSSPSPPSSLRPASRPSSRRAKIQDFFAKNGIFFLLTLFTAVTIHVLFVFSIGQYLSKTTFDRIKTNAAFNNEQAIPLSDGSFSPAPPASNTLASGNSSQQPSPQTLPPAAKGLNFDREPAAFFSVCRYDVSAHALNISVTLGTDSLLALTFRDSLGNSYQAMSDEGLTQDRLDITVSLANRNKQDDTQDTDDDTPHALQITTPTAEGFVLFSVTPKRAAARSDAEAVVKSISCTKAAN